MGYLNVDLWPSALALLFAGAAIVAMRWVERRADKSATLRTQEALRQALADPTEE
jgi:HAMP domain-containing protein